MGMSYDKIEKIWTVFYSKRHPITRQPYSLRRKGFKTEAEAKREERKLVIEIEDRIQSKLFPKWKDFLITFYESQKERGLSLKTIYSYQTCIEKFTLKSWSEKRVDQIKRPEIRLLVDEVFVNCSDTYKKYLLKCIRAVFHFAVESGVLTENPTPLIKFKVKDKIKMGLTESQASLLLEKARAMNHDWYAVWATALYTGMRNGELFALSWQNVNFEDRTIKVCQSWNNRDGFKDTKSGDDRIVELPHALVPVFRDLKVQSFYGDFVLPRIVKWDRGEQARELRMFLTGIGLPEIRFHDLRATWATILLSKGVEPIKVMKMGGWKDMDTMMIYVRKAGVDIRGATDKLVLHDHKQRLANVIQLGF